MVYTYGEYEITDDICRTDFELVHRWLADSYWSPGISRTLVERGAANSALVVGAFHTGCGEQAGFLRVVSDTTRFAWICDVYVAAEHRRKGLARQMVGYATSHPTLADVVRWALATRDAQDVYRAAGFTELPEPSRWMQYRPEQHPHRAR